MSMKRWTSSVLLLGICCLPVFAQKAPNAAPPEEKLGGHVDLHSEEENIRYQQLSQDGRGYFKQEHWGDAEKALSGALEVQYSPGTMFYYARSLENQGKDQQALPAYRRLFSNGSTTSASYNGYIAYADLAAKLGSPEEIALAYNKLLEKHRPLLEESKSYLGKKPDLRRLRTVALVAAAMESNSIRNVSLKYYRDAVASDARYAPAQLGLGKMLADSSKAAERAEATQCLQQAASLGSKDLMRNNVLVLSAADLALS